MRDYRGGVKLLILLLLVLFYLAFSLAGLRQPGAPGSRGALFGFLRSDPARPFPQHVAYTPDSIRPLVEQQDLDAATARFYTRWRDRYLKKDPCGSERYYVWFDSVHGGGNASAGSIAVSEGQGYGMIIVAYLAGYDPQAHTYFDGLYNFYKAHISDTAGSALMAWNQVAGCRNAPGTDSGGGSDSSTDADIDIAYALLLADRQWGSDGAIDYRHEAKRIIRDILRYDINHRSWLPKLGNSAFPGDPEYFDTRSSDFITDHFRAFQAVSGEDKWQLVIDRIYHLVARMQEKFSPDTGLLPDFIQGTDVRPVPAAGRLLESRYDGSYHENACRLPWRLATDYLLYGEKRAKKAVERINGWVMRATQGDPGRIRAGYTLAGKGLPGSDYPSAAFVAPLAVGAMVDADNQLWLDHLWTYLVEDKAFRIGRRMYYENTLKLLAMLVLSGNWWAPER